MANCPKPDRLLRLLGDEPPEGDQSELYAHIEACAHCRGLLDRMAAQSGIWNDLALLREPPSKALFVDDASLLEGGLPDDESIPLGLMEPPDEPGSLGKLGPYSVIRQIGRGGMGIVFLAKDHALNRLVAIKLLTPGMAATGAARRRFAREARAAAAVVHEHVV
ncbi:GIN domain-containing protein, partial [Singulisphaera rosea]